METQSFNKKYAKELREITNANSKSIRKLLAIEDRNEKEQAHLEKLWDVTLKMFKQIYVLEKKCD